jgi:hypothetical protein
MLEMLQVHNQGVNAKTKENKQLANNASTDVQKNTDIETKTGIAKEGSARLSTDDSKNNKIDHSHQKYHKDKDEKIKAESAGTDVETKTGKDKEVIAGLSKVKSKKKTSWNNLSPMLKQKRVMPKMELLDFPRTNPK